MSAQARRAARADAAHAAATAPVRWRCVVDGCALRGRWVPAQDKTAALRAADRHYQQQHAEPPPDDLEEQRAAWVRAGRPPFGA